LHQGRGRHPQGSTRGARQGPSWRRACDRLLVQRPAQIYMLVVYRKAKKDDLSDKETAILLDLVKEL